MIKASIILPTFNNADSLAITIDTLTSQEFPKTEYEIIIVDNGSTDHTANTSKSKIIKYPNHNIRYYYEPEPGSLAARHSGVFESVGEILVFVDDDIDADNIWLSAIVNTFKDSTIQLIGGKNLPKFEVPPPDWIDIFYKKKHSGIICGPLSLLDFGEKIIDIDPNFIWTLNFSIRRKAFYDLRGFHPNIYPSYLQHYQGDGEGGLTLKAQHQGYRSVYQPEALIYHRIPASRLTLEYFERRAFFQGVSNSFSQIRNLYMKEYGNISHENYSDGHWLIKKIKQPLIHIYNNAQLFIGEKVDSSEIIKKRNCIWNAKYSGFKFHQTAVKCNNDLLSWILKKDYWDYQLPDINTSKIKVGDKYRHKYSYYCR